MKAKKKAWLIVHAMKRDKYGDRVQHKITANSK